MASVALCQRLVVQLNGKMLEFAFRNGHLRRKFDSLKYSLRAIENSLCELSFVEPLQEIVREQTKPKRQRVEDSLSGNSTEPPSRSSTVVDSVSAPVIGGSSQTESVSESLSNSNNMAVDDDTSLEEVLLDTAGFDAIRARLEAADAIREEAIKMSRDAQKWSKQAIFAVQRAAYTEATTKLKSAESVLLKIQTLIEPVRI